MSSMFVMNSGLECTGNEQNLNECSKIPTNCSHMQDASVVCKQVAHVKYPQFFPLLKFIYNCSTEAWNGRKARSVIYVNAKHLTDLQFNHKSLRTNTQPQR